MSLTAAPDVQRRLLDLQDLDTRLVQLDRRASAHPARARVEELTTQLRALDTTGAAVLGRLDDARAEQRRREEEVKVVDARMARDATLLQSTASTKDAQGLESELASLTRRKSDLEDLELAAMEQVETAETELATHTAERQLVADAREAAAGELTTDLAAIAAERATTETARGDLAKVFPDELLALYERQRARYGFGASLLTRRVSSASGVELTGSDLAAVRSAAPDAVLLCPDSQAILVRTEESGL